MYSDDMMNFWSCAVLCYPTVEWTLREMFQYSFNYYYDNKKLNASVDYFVKKKKKYVQKWNKCLRSLYTMCWLK